VAVVDEFRGRIAADTRINAYFKQTALTPTAREIQSQSGRPDLRGSGGPCKYKGKKAAHAGNGDRQRDF